ncbi:hypothetical protein [Faecalibacterium sp. An77]|uniref:hypothetical protein n=1 Tax=Faecalibacterium sp. An77 TaxID=1965655 RepID=UPI00118624CA|nr:hypothetical protein [Faecalibacterium sp. An77]
MTYRIDELYAECVQEWNSLYRMLEQDQQCLSNCIGGDLLPLYQKNAAYLLQQLDEIQGILRQIYGG